MTAQLETSFDHPRPPARVASGPAPEALTAIYDDDVNAAVWERSVVEFTGSGEPDPLQHDLKLEGSVPAAGVDRWLAEQLPLGPAALRADIAELAAMYACLFAVDELGIRLKTLDRAMCPRFHVDRVVCRLLTTYDGPGTEYLADDDVDRAQLGRPVADPRQLPAYDAAAPVHRLPAGAVVLCKGESWPGNEGRGFVHRSPQPAGVRPRLMLCIDGLSHER